MSALSAPPPPPPSAAQRRVHHARPYQLDLFERAKRCNMVVFMPTNSGKTHIACMTIEWYLEQPQHKDQIVIFLANKVLLANQQRNVIDDYLQGRYSVTVVSGQSPRGSAERQGEAAPSRRRRERDTQDEVDTLADRSGGGAGEDEDDAFEEAAAQAYRKETSHDWSEVESWNKLFNKLTKHAEAAAQQDGLPAPAPAVAEGVSGGDSGDAVSRLAQLEAYDDAEEEGVDADAGDDESLDRVFVMTPEALLQKLLQGIIPLSRVCLMVFDESHHHSGNDAYRIIMEQHYFRKQGGRKSLQAKRLPRVLGLTASPIKQGVTDKKGRMLNDVAFEQSVKEALLDTEQIYDARLASPPEEQIDQFLTRCKTVRAYYTNSVDLKELQVDVTKELFAPIIKLLEKPDANSAYRPSPALAAALPLPQARRRQRTFAHFKEQQRERRRRYLQMLRESDGLVDESDEEGEGEGVGHGTPDGGERSAGWHAARVRDCEWELREELMDIIASRDPTLNDLVLRLPDQLGRIQKTLLKMLDNLGVWGFCESCRRFVTPRVSEEDEVTLELDEDDTDDSPYRTKPPERFSKRRSIVWLYIKSLMKARLDRFMWIGCHDQLDQAIRTARRLDERLDPRYEALAPRTQRFARVRHSPSLLTEDNKWACARCTVHNDLNDPRCPVCYEGERPPSLADLLSADSVQPGDPEAFIDNYLMDMTPPPPRHRSAPTPSPSQPNGFSTESSVFETVDEPLRLFVGVKLLLLEKLVRHHRSIFCDLWAEGGDGAPGCKTLVFCETRLTTRVVYKYLKRRGIGKLGWIMGVNENSKDTSVIMKAHRQRMTLDRFRKDPSDPKAIDTMVCTKVLEEGMDVPQCNLVIRFDPFKTPVEDIQGRGRARRTPALCIHIVLKGDTGHENLLARTKLFVDFLAQVAKDTDRRILGRQSRLRLEYYDDTFTPNIKIPTEHSHTFLTTARSQDLWHALAQHLGLFDAQKQATRAALVRHDRDRGLECYPQFSLDQFIDVKREQGKVVVRIPAFRFRTRLQTGGGAPVFGWKQTPALEFSAEVDSPKTDDARKVGCVHFIKKILDLGALDEYLKVHRPPKAKRPEKASRWDDYKDGDAVELLWRELPLCLMPPTEDQRKFLKRQLPRDMRKEWQPIAVDALSPDMPPIRRSFELVESPEVRPRDTLGAFSYNNVAFVPAAGSDGLQMANGVCRSVVLFVHQVWYRPVSASAMEFLAGGHMGRWRGTTKAGQQVLQPLGILLPRRLQESITFDAFHPYDGQKVVVEVRPVGEGRPFSVQEMHTLGSFKARYLRELKIHNFSVDQVAKKMPPFQRLDEADSDPVRSCQPFFYLAPLDHSGELPDMQWTEGALQLSQPRENPTYAAMFEAYSEIFKQWQRTSDQHALMDLLTAFEQRLQQQDEQDAASETSPAVSAAASAPSPSPPTDPESERERQTRRRAGLALLHLMRRGREDPVAQMKDKRWQFSRVKDVRWGMGPGDVQEEDLSPAADAGDGADGRFMLEVENIRQGPKRVLDRLPPRPPRSYDRYQRPDNSLFYPLTASMYEQLTWTPATIFKTETCGKALDVKEALVLASRIRIDALRLFPSLNFKNPMYPETHERLGMPPRPPKPTPDNTEEANTSNTSSSSSGAHAAIRGVEEASVWDEGSRLSVRWSGRVSDLSFPLLDASSVVEALTAPSAMETIYAPEEGREDEPFNYQRLEFLGDAILKFLAVNYAWEILPGESEEIMSFYAMALQRNALLKKHVRRTRLHSALHTRTFVAKNTRLTDLRWGPVAFKTQADIMEALIGAFYLSNLHQDTTTPIDPHNHNNTNTPLLMNGVDHHNHPSSDVTASHDVRSVGSPAAIAAAAAVADSILQTNFLTYVARPSLFPADMTTQTDSWSLERPGADAPVRVPSEPLSLPHWDPSRGDLGGEGARSEREEKVLDRVEAAWGYRFRNRGLLKQAVTVRGEDVSAGRDSMDPTVYGSLERLEFLGDGVLQATVTHWLYLLFDRVKEGPLTRVRSELVRNRYLCRRLCAKAVALGQQSSVLDLLIVNNAQVREHLSEFERSIYRPSAARGERDFLRPVTKDEQRQFDLERTQGGGGEGGGGGNREEEDEFQRKMASLDDNHPKSLADVYEALVGATFLDLGGDLRSTWRVIGGDFTMSYEAANEYLEEEDE
ncbi:unnamed protein product [Vitrella brassicaformis CCMP3155]|uniref:Uncharacterized protein n=1 Tax=Vitrella brassicaformis (strain CCMP3155) TaxID=1169540 RepID=A0A0G4F5Y7_VITBC|nr:unnamed protein product [Vitrella brassicaformis CCMP3155]|eukprot:CEM07638.1 unnamed protein product [Vitrella brassicaformis CCMP3155]